jgi:hypothetical protein
VFHGAYFSQTDDEYDMHVLLNLLTDCIINAAANIRGTVNVELEEMWREVVGHSALA